MAKGNQIANEAQLKARRTSLGKKSKDELINIILRKDKSERKMNAKIQELTGLLKEADELNEEKATRILNFDKDMNGMQDKVNSLVERNDNILLEKKDLEKEVVRLKNKCNILRKGTITFIGISVILAILIIFL